MNEFLPLTNTNLMLENHY